jgi:hypothetical protein
MYHLPREKITVVPLGLEKVFLDAQPGAGVARSSHQTIQLAGRRRPAASCLYTCFEVILPSLPAIAHAC